MMKHSTIPMVGKRSMMVIVIAIFVIATVFYQEKYGVQRSNEFSHFSTASLFGTDEALIKEESRPYLIPSINELKGKSVAEMMGIYWKYINTLQVLCMNQTRVGSLRDGGKEVCIDKKYIPRKPCLVYSFGSNFQFDFENSVVSKYDCEVHTFDPSKAIPDDKIIPPSTTFHLTGLGGENFVNKDKWKKRTLGNITKELHHDDIPISILKIDIEGSEWPSLQEAVDSGSLKNVKQICLEVHIRKNDGLMQQLNVLRQLYEQGFRIFMRDRNLGTIREEPSLGEITTVTEISLININWKRM